MSEVCPRCTNDDAGTPRATEPPRSTPSSLTTRHNRAAHHPSQEHIDHPLVIQRSSCIARPILSTLKPGLSDTACLWGRRHKYIQEGTGRPGPVVLGVQQWLALSC